MAGAVRVVKTNPGDRLAFLVEAVKSRPRSTAIIRCCGPRSLEFLQVLFDLLDYNVKSAVEAAADRKTHKLVVLATSLATLTADQFESPVVYAYDPIKADVLEQELTQFGGDSLCFHFKLIKGNKKVKATPLPLLRTLQCLSDKHYELRRCGEAACHEFYKHFYSAALTKTPLHKSFLLPVPMRPAAKLMGQGAVGNEDQY